MPERVLYFDCFSGVAGDMTLGALLDLGVDGLDPAALTDALGTLPLPPWHLETSVCLKHGLRGLKAHLTIEGQEEGAAVDADAPAEPAPEGPEAPTWSVADVHAALRGGCLPGEVVSRAVAAFDEVVRAHAFVQGLTPDTLRLPSLGAVDAVLDLAGGCWGLWRLGLDAVECAPLPVGRGFVREAWGRAPNPTPTTLEVLRGLEVAPSGLDRELVTPTGAALVKTWARRQGGFPTMSVERVGYGAGNADFPDRPNLLRLVLGRRGAPNAAPDDALVVEAELSTTDPAAAATALTNLAALAPHAVHWAPLPDGRLVVGARVPVEHVPAAEALLAPLSHAAARRRFPSPWAAESTPAPPIGACPVALAPRDSGRVNVIPALEACARPVGVNKRPPGDVLQSAIAATLARFESDPSA